MNEDHSLINLWVEKLKEAHQNNDFKKLNTIDNNMRYCLYEEEIIEVYKRLGDLI